MNFSIDFDICVQRLNQTWHDICVPLVIWRQGHKWCNSKVFFRGDGWLWWWGLCSFSCFSQVLKTTSFKLINAIETTSSTLMIWGHKLKGFFIGFWQLQFFFFFSFLEKLEVTRSQIRTDRLSGCDILPKKILHEIWRMGSQDVENRLMLYSNMCIASTKHL